MSMILKIPPDMAGPRCGGDKGLLLLVNGRGAAGARILKNVIFDLDNIPIKPWS
jgi:hypothetical protein